MIDRETEIIPIAIPLKSYNQHIAELVEHLLTIEGKLKPTSSEAI